MAKNLSDMMFGDRSLVRDYHSGGYNSFFGNSKPTKSCYHDHPAMPLPGTDFVIYGGSCMSPIVKDADVYVGLDGSMSFTPRHWPWKSGAEVLFKITDQQAPASLKDFRKLIAWIKEHVDAGRKVHVGCIGGHGRTGTVLAALVSLYGEKDAITYVREHYCKKAVESETQVKFLVSNFGIKRAQPRHSHHGNGGTGRNYPVKAGAIVPLEPNTANKADTCVEPVSTGGSIWGF